MGYCAGTPTEKSPSSELLYKSNIPQVSVGYRLINHLGCWYNTRRIRKPLACSSWFRNCAVPENIYTPPHRRDWNFLEDRGFWKIKKYKEMYKALLEFPEGWGGVKRNLFRGGGVDIFWNYTFFSCFTNIPHGLSAYMYNPQNLVVYCLN